MRKKIVLLASAVTLFLITSPEPAPAQPGRPPIVEMPRLFGSFTLRNGVWSEYAVTEKETGRKTSMRLAVVGEEGGSYWYEVRLVEGGNRNIIKMLLTGDPGNSENIQRLIIQSGENQAMEMPKEFVSMGRKMAASMFESRSGAAVASNPEVKVMEIARREVTVPAGTFETAQRKLTDAGGKVLASYDINSKVLPIGVVISDTEQTSMELLAYGTDATSEVNGEPVVFTPPAGMPGGPPPGMMGTPPGGMPEKE